MRARGKVLARSSVAHALAATLAAGVVATSAAACRDIVTDEVVDVSGTLCGTLSACGIERGCDLVSGFFGSEGSPVEVDAYLEWFDEQSCADGCGTAPACLDYPGICKVPGEEPTDCAADAECCGGTTGAAQCDPAERNCCRGLGVPCAEDVECCALEGNPVECVEESAATALGESAIKTCGGLPACVLFEDECSEDAECCSGVCDGGSCGRITCVAAGDKCQNGDTCCDEGLECSGQPGVCKAPERPECEDPTDDPALCCAPDGGSCLLGERVGPELPCCGSDEAVCFERPGGDTVCAYAGCAPTGALCTNDVQCCQPGGDRNAACITIGGSDLGVCQDLACEPDEGQPCGGGCCAGLKCDEENGTCELDCSAGECHPPGEIGASIKPEDCPAEAECAQAVCEEDRYCCCFGWDSGCVLAAQQTPECVGLL